MTSIQLRAMCLPLFACIASFSLAGNASGQCTPDFAVTAPGQWTGDTCGAADDCDLRPSEEHIYEIEILTDGDWAFSLCDSSFDTFLYLGTTCCGQEVGFDDDTCAPQSELIVLGLTAGTYYLTIEGYADFDCGGYTLDVFGFEPELDCPDDALFGQYPYGPNSMWEVGLSDSGTPENHLRYDNFTVDGVSRICAVHWWGLILNYDGEFWSDCPTENPMDFDIRFYLNNRRGTPGAEQCAYLNSVIGVPTGLFYGPFELYSFATNLNPQCVLADGWISIQGDTLSNPDCWFIWISSPAGDDASWRRESGNMIEDVLDWAFCLIPSSVWDCHPDNGDGTFGDGMVDIDDLFAVLANWGPCGGSPCPWDCHPDNGDGTYGDGVVDINDIYDVIYNWGLVQ